MKKKDFELIAKVIRKNAEQAQGNLSESVAIESVAVDFSDALEKINPRFKRDLFLKECGVL